jgi:hypothetical protein
VAQGGHAIVETPPIAPTQGTGIDQIGEGAPIPRGVVAHYGGLPAIPELFRLQNLNLDLVTMVSVDAPPNDWSNIAPKDWLWGQYNRYLPVKATCRALMHMLNENPKGVPMDDAASKISYAACGLGDFLSALDRRYVRRREDAMAAAFPTSAISGGQGRIRFGNQFVGALKQGKLTGFPGSLRLLGCDFSKDTRLTLTSEGMAFATLENPILDTDREMATRTLSESEIQFLLEHVRALVPEETSAFISIIDGVEKGANTPDTIDAYLRERFHLENDAAMTPAFLSTQRTGAISRMVELGLLAREKAGLRVTYVVTHPGKCFHSQVQ